MTTRPRDHQVQGHGLVPRSLASSQSGTFPASLLEQAARGVLVRHEATTRPYEDVLRHLAAELGPLRVMAPAERELRVAVEPLVRSRACPDPPISGT